MRPGIGDEAGLYFAYGSNLAEDRMVERVPGTCVLSPARLRGHRLVCDKAGADGSAKANLKVDPGGEVWGVVYRLGPEGLDRLDRFEGGYERCAFALETPDGGSLRATTYRSDRTMDDPRPFAWYLELIVRGARAQGLPAPYVARIAAWPSRPDPDAGPAERPR